MAKTTSELIKDFWEKNAASRFDDNLLKMYNHNKKPRPGTIHEIINSYIKENYNAADIKTLVDSRGKLTIAARQAVFGNLEPQLQAAKSDYDYNLHAAPVDLNINLITAVPDILKQFCTTKNKVFAFPCKTQDDFDNNFEILKDFLGEKVLMWQGMELNDKGDIDKHVGIHYGTDKGEKLAECQAAYNIGYEIMYQGKLKNLNTKDRKVLDERYAEICKILGVKQTKDSKTFTGPGSMQQLRTGIGAKIETLSTTGETGKVVRFAEDTLTEQIRRAVDPATYSGYAAEDRPYKCPNTRSEDVEFAKDFKVLSDNITKMSHSNAVTSVMALMETPEILSRIPQGSTKEIQDGTHSDEYIKGFMATSPDRKAQSIDRVLQKSCRDGVSAKFDFNVKVHPALLKGEFADKGVITVGDYIDEIARRMVRQKARMYVIEREKHGIGHIIDKEAVKETLDADISNKGSGGKKNKIVSKPPYRALTKVMKMVEQLAAMLCKAFQKMVASGGFVQMDTAEEFARKIGLSNDKGQRTEFLREFLSGEGKDLIRPLCNALKDKKKEDLKKQSKGKKPSVVAVTDAATEMAKLLADIEKMYSKPDELESLLGLVEGGRQRYNDFAAAKKKKINENEKREEIKLRNQQNVEAGILREAEKYAQVDDQMQNLFTEYQVADSTSDFKKKSQIFEDIKKRVEVDRLKERKSIEEQQRAQERAPVIYEAMQFAQNNPELKRLVNEYNKAELSKKDIFFKEIDKIVTGAKIKSGGEVPRELYVKSINSKCEDVKSLDDFENLCDIVKLHDVLRKHSLGQAIEKEKTNGEPIYSSILNSDGTKKVKDYEPTETGENMKSDLVLLEKRIGAMNHLKGGELRNIRDGVKGSGSEEKEAMQKAFVDTMIGSGKNGKVPPRGIYQNSGIDTIDPDKCMTTIMVDIVELAQKDPSLSLLESVIGKTYGNVDIKAIINKLSSCSKDVNGEKIFDKSVFMHTVKTNFMIEQQREKENNK